MADRAWWDVLGVDRMRAASWHRMSIAGRLNQLRAAFELSIGALEEIEAWTVVPLLNAYQEGKREMTNG